MSSGPSILRRPFSTAINLGERQNCEDILGHLLKSLNSFRRAEVSRQSSTKPAELSIEVYAWTTRELHLMEHYMDVVRKLINRIDGSKVSGVINEPMGIKKWSILSSPFIHKTAFTQFERRTFHRRMNCYGLSESLYPQLTWYITRNAPPNVHLHYKLHYPISIPAVSASDSAAD